MDDLLAKKGQNRLTAEEQQALARLVNALVVLVLVFVLFASCHGLPRVAFQAAFDDARVVAVGDADQTIDQHLTPRDDRAHHAAQLGLVGHVIAVDGHVHGRPVHAEEVIAHLVGQAGSDVTVTIEIEANLPIGASDQVIRTVTENSRTLRFSSAEFESE